MSIRDHARNSGAMRTPALRIPFDGTAIRCYLDAGQDPRTVALHDLGKKGKRSCSGADCGLCAAGAGDPDVSHVVSVDQIGADGVIEPRSLWLRRRELGALAQVLPDAGSVEIEAAYLPREGAELREDGEPWRDLTFRVVGDAAADGGQP